VNPRGASVLEADQLGKVITFGEKTDLVEQTELIGCGFFREYFSCQAWRTPHKLENVIDKSEPRWSLSGEPLEEQTGVDVSETRLGSWSPTSLELMSLYEYANHYALPVN